MTEVRTTATDQYLSLNEVAEQLGTSSQTVRRWVKSGELPAYKPGKEWRIKEGDLTGFLEARSTPKVQAPLSSVEEPETAQAERRVIESLFQPWVGWLERDAAYLTEVTHARGVDRGAHEKILADRRNTLQALDEVGIALEKLGIDWTDRRNRVLRRARRDLQSAFDDWTDAWLEARTTYLDSLAGSELAQARQAHDEEQERSGNKPEWLQEAG